VLCLWSTSVCAQPRYTLVKLGPIIPAAMATNGVIAGYFDGDPDEAVVVKGESLLVIGPSGTDSTALGVNAKGVAVGTVTHEDQTTRPFIFTKAKGFQMLPMPTDSVSAGAGDVNASGTAVGSSETSLTRTPLVWRHGVMSILDTGGATWAHATTINDVGTIGGDIWDQAVLWRQGVLTPLGTFDGTMATVVVVTNDESLLVNAQVHDYHYLIRQVAGEESIHLPNLPQSISCFGNGLSGGIAVGGCILGEEGEQTGQAAALWTADGQVYDLDDVIGGAEGVHLAVATAIIENGQITAIGYEDGVLRGFLLVPETDAIN
jgi:hypothetical protein